MLLGRSCNLCVRLYLMVSKLPVFILSLFIEAFSVYFHASLIFSLTLCNYTFFRENCGGGVMNLVYGSSSSSYMDWKVFFGDECFSFRRSGVRLDQCSCIGAFVVGLIIFGNYVYGSTTFRMSTRQLPVILFVSRLSIHLYPVVCCAECLWWQEEAFTLYAYVGMSVILNSFIAF